MYIHIYMHVISAKKEVVNLKEYRERSMGDLEGGKERIVILTIL